MMWDPREHSAGSAGQSPQRKLKRNSSGLTRCLQSMNTSGHEGVSRLVRDKIGKTAASPPLHLSRNDVSVQPLRQQKRFMTFIYSKLALCIWGGKKINKGDALLQLPMFKHPYIGCSSGNMTCFANFFASIQSMSFSQNWLKHELKKKHEYMKSVLT